MTQASTNTFVTLLHLVLFYTLAPLNVYAAHVIRHVFCNRSAACAFQTVNDVRTPAEMLRRQTWRQAWVRQFKPPNSDGNLARSLCASSGRQTQHINLGAKPVYDPKPSKHTSTVASDVNLGSKPVCEPQAPISDVKSCPVTQIPLIPAFLDKA